jgi:alanyl-tRNA synthetase
VKTSEIRRRFIDFYVSRGHSIIPSSSLVPENDPTTLFISAGMQPLVPFFLGERHPQGKHLVNVQKCVRTDDIEEVGDRTHTTFFEMLGRWSLGDYFKPEAIESSFEFLTSDEGLALDTHRLYVTFFGGDEDVPRDAEALETWRRLLDSEGMDAAVGDPDDGWESGRIFPYGKKENWWGPVGSTGPCGPDSEIFYDTAHEHDLSFGPVCHPNCNCGRFVEVGNDVFLEYERLNDGRYRRLGQKSVDTGMGLERLAMVHEGAESVWEIDVNAPIVGTLELGAQFDSDHSAVRIVVDHIKAAVFLMSDGVIPSNVDRGYVVRRLIRRAVRHGSDLALREGFSTKVADSVIGVYGSIYEELINERDSTLKEIEAEEERFRRTLDKGSRRLERLMAAHGALTGQEAFTLYDTYGFPLELTVELAERKGVPLVGDFTEDFHEAMRLQKDRSRAATQRAFKGGLADHSEVVTWYHTATHLTYAALRKYLGSHVHQRGSNITSERLRFDFSHPSRLSEEEKTQVEEYVNKAIRADLDVSYEELPADTALEKGAIGEFGHKYGPVVKVYKMKDPNSGEVWSYEICGGPHVSRTNEIKGTYRILKEEAVASGIRRIRAVVEVE